MGTTTEELKKLYAKLGGADPNIPKASTPGEVLNGINELDLGGDKLPEVTEADNGKALGVKQGQWDKMDVDIELPDVTTDDNGKVLMVSEGNWGKSDLPNNSNVVIYEVKLATAGLELKNATIGDLKNDFDAGKIIILKNTSGHAYADGDLYYCSGKKGGASISDVTFFRIVHMSVNPIKIKVDGCYFDYNGSAGSKTLTTFSDVVGLTPNVSASDNGKILKVVDGIWSTANENTELPAVTASDNGNVLTVVNGAWASAAASGGGDSVVFNVARFIQNGKLDIKDGVTPSDINNAISNGKNPVLFGEDGKVYYYAGSFTNPAGNSSNTFVAYVIEWDSTNSKYIFKYYRVFYHQNKYKCDSTIISIG